MQCWWNRWLCDAVRVPGCVTFADDWAEPLIAREIGIIERRCNIALLCRQAAAAAEKSSWIVESVVPGIWPRWRTTGRPPDDVLDKLLASLWADVTWCRRPIPLCRQSSSPSLLLLSYCSGFDTAAVVIMMMKLHVRRVFRDELNVLQPQFNQFSSFFFKKLEMKRCSFEDSYRLFNF